MKKAPAMKKLPSKVKSKEIKSELNNYDPRPRITISESVLPEIKSWSLNEKYKLAIEVEMTGTRIEDWGNEKGKAIANFTVTKIGISE